MQLAATGELRVGERCLETTAGGALSLATCTGTPAQYWVQDGEGAVWSGLPPELARDMTYDHVRCLDEGMTSTCGDQRRPRWHYLMR
ncbi:MAG: hypothetical protein IPQ07_10235 [Myxococcales bacterium]|nr:hypothetical protein [Myxococcales bacterium]